VIALADDGAAAAEICRRVGTAAECLGLPRPSYQQVRVLLNAQRLRREPAPGAASGVSGWELLADIALRARPATDVAPWAYGERLPYRRGAHNDPRK
jgi:hypothetical protein